MKKLIYLLLVLPFALAFSSCSNDDNLPDVNVTLTFDNAVASDGAIYVVKDATLKLNSIVTTPIDNSKPATLANARFFWNYQPAISMTFSEFPIDIPMADMPLVDKGANLLGINATLLQVDKSIAYTSFNIPIVTVDSESDLPDGQEPGEAVFTLRIGQSKTDK